jgi:hypothetical protein
MKCKWLIILCVSLFLINFVLADNNSRIINITNSSDTDPDPILEPGIKLPHGGLGGYNSPDTMSPLIDYSVNLSLGMVSYVRFTQNTTLGENMTQVWDYANNTFASVSYISVYDNTGGLNGLQGAFLQNGTHGQYFIFNGTDPYKENKNFSVSLWYKAYALPDNQNYYLIRNYDAPSDNDFDIYIRNDTRTTHLDFAMHKTSGFLHNQYLNPNLTDNKWHSVIAVFNSSNLLTYYDGALVKNTAFPALRGSTLAQNLLLGGWEGGDSLNGTLNEVMVFNKDLNSTEVAYYSTLSNYFPQSPTSTVNPKLDSFTENILSIVIGFISLLVLGVAVAATVYYFKDLEGQYSFDNLDAKKVILIAITFLICVILGSLLINIIYQLM